MRTFSAFLGALALTALAAGCTTVDDKSTAAAKAPGEYRTGSNIPSRAAAPASSAQPAN